MNIEKKKSKIGKIALVAGNMILIVLAVLFAVWYSREVTHSQEQLMLENFCNTVETMKQISVRYLSGELEKEQNWAAYIQRQHMTMDEAIEYIRSVSDVSECEGHLVDMDTFEAWSTNETDGNNTIGRYREYFQSSDSRLQEYVERMKKIFAGEKWVLGKFNIRESQRNVIGVGGAVTLRQPDGTDRDYLLLRIVPVERMKELWLFPVNYASAEIGLITPESDYVIPSRSMRSENFIEFVRAYNFQDDYSGADQYLAQLKDQSGGLMVLNDSKGQTCYWYYSKLNEFEGLDILGYIPVSALSVTVDNISIVLVVAFVLLLLALIDGLYILNINRKLRVAVDVAEKASSAKTRFLSSMSHDIRTPLNAVLGMTELAKSHADDGAYVQECLRKISLSGNHLLTLINDILEISRVESGKISVTPAPFDVKELASNLESLTRSPAAGHGLTFEVSLGALPSPWLMGDKLRLTQVYLNLLNNAVKYTAPGGTVRLEMWEEVQKDDIILGCIVADNGVGMSPEFQKVMYESFTRVADSRTDKIQGTGLGLSIVSQMVRLMNGTIDCESAEGAGTTFTVRIPLVAAGTPTPLPAEEAADISSREADLSGLHILIAEDNDLNWEIISAMLDGCGIQCERAENGQECVETLEKMPPDTYDLVLMDIQMPVLNGRDATRRLRKSEREDLRTIPVIAMTADAFAEDVQMCLDAGMDAHVAKPIELEKVLAQIRVLRYRKNQ